MQHRARATVAAVVVAIVAACGGGDPPPEGTFELPGSEADDFDTAYVAVVVADPPGSDLARGGGEHVVIRNNATIRIDMGGWWLDVGGERLPLGIGRQIDVDAELRVHVGPGDTGEDAVFVGLDEPVLDDESGLVVLRDAAGSEVARFRYGS